MAGLGRRSHYRKHLTDSVLHDLPEPSENERIAKVFGTRGSNQFELIVDPGPGSGSGSDQLDMNMNMTRQLAILPTKFRKLVWLKRNDYVICAVAEDEKQKEKENNDDNDKDDSKDKCSGVEGGIRYMIQHILYKDQIKHLKDNGLWPKNSFFLDSEEEMDDIRNGEGDDDDNGNGDSDSGDDIVYNDYTDDDYFCNMNRIANLKVDDSSDDSEGESD